MRTSDRFERFSQRLIPPGASVWAPVRFFVLGNIISFLFSLSFWVGYASNYATLYYVSSTGYKYRSARMMPDIDDIFKMSPLVTMIFLICAICCAFWAVYYYMYYRTETKSIYLMKRLPKKLELHRRALTVPVLMALAFIFFAVLTCFVYFIMYLLITPNDALAPDQWDKFWRYLLCLR